MVGEPDDCVPSQDKSEVFKFISYTPPEGYIQWHHAPDAAEWAHPDDERAANIELHSFLYERLMRINDRTSLVPSWKSLSEVAALPPRGMWFGRCSELEVREEIVDDQKVLVTDFVLEYSADELNYYTRIWIPISEGCLISGVGAGQSPAIRDRIR